MARRINGIYLTREDLKDEFKNTNIENIALGMFKIVIDRVQLPTKV